MPSPTEYQRPAIFSGSSSGSSATLIAPAIVLRAPSSICPPKGNSRLITAGIIRKRFNQPLTTSTVRTRLSSSLGVIDPVTAR